MPPGVPTRDKEDQLASPARRSSTAPRDKIRVYLGDSSTHDQREQHAYSTRSRSDHVRQSLLRSG